MWRLTSDGKARQWYEPCHVCGAYRPVLYMVKDWLERWHCGPDYPPCLVWCPGCAVLLPERAVGSVSRTCAVCQSVVGGPRTLPQQYKVQVQLNDDGVLELRRHD